MKTRSVFRAGHELAGRAGLVPLLVVASLTAGLKGCANQDDSQADEPPSLAATAAQAVQLAWSGKPPSPASGEITLSWTGQRLVNVEVFSSGKMILRAKVASDGKSAKAVLDTRTLPNGKVALSAHAWDSAHDTPFTGEADAGQISFVVDNEVEADVEQPAPQEPASSSKDDFHPADYQLAFSDEFSGDTLDRGKWCTRYIYGGGPALQVPDDECQHDGDGTLDFLNAEQQRYVDTNRQKKKMHEQRDGILTLWATKTRDDDDYAKYESAMLRSKQLFRPDKSTAYYMTARLKLPSVRGSWPAFWLNSDRKPDGSTSWPPEIDIIDAALNDKDDTAEMLHQAGIVKGKQTSSGESEYTFVSPEFDTKWSNYRASTSQRDIWIEVAAHWTADSVCYFVGGYKTACERYRWVDDDGELAPPAHVLLNLAVGGDWAGRYGVDDSSFPIKLEADYVRVYKGPPPRD